MPRFFFFNDTATTEIYTLSLHDALPISQHMRELLLQMAYLSDAVRDRLADEGSAILEIDRAISQALRSDKLPREHLETALAGDRKSTRLNSSHSQISYAVFCLKKKR